MLERHELEAFLTLAEELHFGRTAQRLHVSTARISQTIRKLERRIGVPLFTRTSRVVELTAVGRQLHDDLRPAWAQVTAAVERAVAAGRGVTGTLRVAFTGAAAGQLLAGAAELFQTRHPDCEVRIREARLVDVVAWLRDSEVDAVLATFPAPDGEIATGPVLVREAQVLAVPYTHPFARLTSVSVADLPRVRVLRDAETFNEVLTRIGAGHGVLPVGAQTARYYPRPDVAYIPFSDAPPLEWGLMWRAAGARVLAFSQAAHDLVQDG